METEFIRKRKRGKRVPAFTLAEMLVVMVLSGIVLLAVFRGYSLFETLLKQAQGVLEADMKRLENRDRFMTLVSECDSIREEGRFMRVFGADGVRAELVRNDSVLTVVWTGGKTDTLFSGIVFFRTVFRDGSSGLVDSLIVINDGVEWRFAVRYDPGTETERLLERMEEEYAHEN